ncbi:MAG: hypothetical protein RL226_2305 [Bacteroidota bacterium]|jgi:acetyl esterase/lipase
MKYLIVLLFFFSLGTARAGISETVVYAEKQGKRLEFDVFRAQHAFATILFVHGGGFYAGTRHDESILQFCDSMQNAGVNVVNMSYRLFLEGQKFDCNQPIPRKIEAIATAAEDIIDAAQYIKMHDLELGLQNIPLILMGSSAGAEAAYYAIYNLHATAFDAVIGLAGALPEIDMVTAERALPTVMFHGSCDPLVPYNEGIHHYCSEQSPGALYLYGSHAIYEKLVSLNQPTVLVTACGGKHGSAVSPLKKDKALLLNLISKIATAQLETAHIIRETDSTCQLPDGGVCD